MGDRIGVMKDGVLQQIGTPATLYTSPVNTFVATFIGSPAMNLLPAERFGLGPSGQLAGIRPEHVRLGSGELAGTVEVVEYLGDEQVAHLRVRDTPIVAKAAADPLLEAGREVALSFEAGRALLFDAASGDAVGRAA